MPFRGIEGLDELLSDVTAAAVHGFQWALAHPEEARQLLDESPSRANDRNR